jgi:hypothetical protein
VLNDVSAAAATSLLLPANLLIFAAKLDGEAMNPNAAIWHAWLGLKAAGW